MIFMVPLPRRRRSWLVRRVHPAIHETQEPVDEPNQQLVDREDKNHDDHSGDDHGPDGILIPNQMVSVAPEVGNVLFHGEGTAARGIALHTLADGIADGDAEQQRHDCAGHDPAGRDAVRERWCRVHRGSYTPQAARKTSLISPSVARVRTASRIGSISGAAGTRAARSRAVSARFTFPGSRFPRSSATRLRWASASVE